MRAALCLVALVQIVGVAAQPTDTISINAWSGTAGPYGVMWSIDVNAGGSGTVVRGGLGLDHQEQNFKVAPRDLEQIRRVIEEVQFFALPDHIGPELVDLHGPKNTLRIRREGRTHQVFFDEPKTWNGPNVDRFKRLWDAITKLSPIAPPLR